ncbi:phage tail protein I [Pseudoalteromonas xiamenensis]|uniref:phage tail protein I n=1 Tax=Pseudoalteromonas xiamenensis TaxID=882626 RepID=UPI0035E9CE49
MTDHTKLLPSNYTMLEHQFVEAIDTLPERLSVTPTIPEHIGKQWDPETCPETLLPWLAWSLSVDDWDEKWPIATKRALIARSVEIHKHKGTVGAVKRALSSLGVKVEFFEWFQDVGELALAPHHSGEPNTFTFIAWANDVPFTSEAVVLSQSVYDAIFRVTNQTKPQRAHFKFLVGAKLDLGVQMASTSSGMQVGRLTYQTQPVNAAASEMTIGVSVVDSQRMAVKRQYGQTQAVNSYSRSDVGLAVVFHNRRQQVGRYYFSNDQKLPSGCYYWDANPALAIHLSNRRFSVGRFYLHT